LLGVVKGEHKFLLYCQYCGYVADVSPQEQWDNIPVIGKLQIFTFVGMLESYGEILGDVPHYTRTKVDNVNSQLLLMYYLRQRMKSGYPQNPLFIRFSSACGS